MRFRGGPRSPWSPSDLEVAASAGPCSRTEPARLRAHVTGVDNGGELEFMRALGADEVIDYRREDFTRDHEPYDLILDLVAHRSVFAYRRALAAGGRYRCVGGSVRALVRVLTIGAIAGRATRRRVGVLVVKQGPAHFEPLADLCVEWPRVQGDLGPGEESLAV